MREKGVSAQILTSASKLIPSAKTWRSSTRELAAAHGGSAKGQRTIALNCTSSKLPVATDGLRGRKHQFGPVDNVADRLLTCRFA